LEEREKEEEKIMSLMGRVMESSIFLATPVTPNLCLYELLGESLCMASPRKV
jgi:hypothetical protein